MEWGRTKTFHRQQKPVLDPEIYNKTEENTGLKYLVNGQGNTYYLDEGQTCDDGWTYVQEKGMNSPNSGSKERLGFATQKPLALLRRIIEASSNEGDLVLDPFCGCGPSLVAAHMLKRKFVGALIFPSTP